jgi:chromosomal replication initiator protein
VDVLLIDDIHFIAGKEATQEEFFHTFNALHDSHKQIIVSSDRPPKEIINLEERLISRFEWGLVTDIHKPDFETRAAILRKKALRHNIPVPDAVNNFIAEIVQSNIRELEGALMRVVAYAELTGMPVTLDLAQEVLKRVAMESEKKITVEFIQKKVSDYFSIRLNELMAKRRSKNVVLPRQIAMFLSRELTNHSLPEIGLSFGGRDHTTVMHACEKIKTGVEKDSNLKEMVHRIRLNISN